MGGVTEDRDLGGCTDWTPHALPSATAGKFFYTMENYCHGYAVKSEVVAHFDFGGDPFGA